MRRADIEKRASIGQPPCGGEALNPLLKQLSLAIGEDRVVLVFFQQFVSVFHLAFGDARILVHHENLLVWCLVGFIAFFGFSQGAVIWVYLSEVFPTRVRAKGQSLGSFTHWIMNALIANIFPVLAASSGGAPFVFFAAMMVLQFFVVLAMYPETKGFSLEEMQHKLGIE